MPKLFEAFSGCSSGKQACAPAGAVFGGGAGAKQASSKAGSQYALEGRDHSAEPQHKARPRCYHSAQPHQSGDRSVLIPMCTHGMLSRASCALLQLHLITSSSLYGPWGCNACKHHSVGAHLKGPASDLANLQNVMRWMPCHSVHADMEEGNEGYDMHKAGRKPFTPAKDDTTSGASDEDDEDHDGSIHHRLAALFDQARERLEVVGRDSFFG